MEFCAVGPNIKCKYVSYNEETRITKCTLYNKELFSTGYAVPALECCEYAPLDTLHNCTNDGDYIKFIGGKWYMVIDGNMYHKPVHYCPFCGEKLESAKGEN